MKQTRIQKGRKAYRNGRLDGMEEQDSPRAHRAARKARVRARRASAKAERFLRETEE